AEFTRRLSRFEELGGPAADGAANTAAWVRWQCRMNGPTAAERVEVATQLAHLPDTAKALSSGELSFQHAAVMARTVTEVGADAVKHAEPLCCWRLSRSIPAASAISRSGSGTCSIRRAPSM